MSVKSRWYSGRIQQESTLVRWGETGQPVLIFPTAGGDCEEIERFHVIRVLQPLLDAGKIKVYSCDSVGGRAFFDRDTTPQHRMWMQNAFHQYVRHEVVPAIRQDCNSADIGIWTSGASIGAFHAAAMVCRFPDIFHKALSLSGTYNLMRFIEVDQPTPDYFVSSPILFVPTLAGPHLDLLRTRYIYIATGAGRAENVGESWLLANALGAKGIPNYLDNWGPEWHHDWITWREMWPKFLGEWTK